MPDLPQIGTNSLNINPIQNIKNKFNSIFGGSNTDVDIDLTGFYDNFYTSFLTCANSLPINSMWLMFIDQLPDVSEYVDSYEGWKIPEEISRAKTEGDITFRKKGILLAQAVKVNGESLNVERTGTKNTGYIQGLVNNGRTAFPTLDVIFAENNISFVDYYLRPWLVAVGHKSLKDQDLKANITVWFLSKGGPRNNPLKRKCVTYFNCRPVSVDQQEYNYSGGDVYLKRTVSFVYTHYDMQNADPTLLSMINDNSSSFFGKLGNDLKTILQRQFGANNPSQYLNGLVNKAASLGRELVTGTATRIVTNVSGHLQDKVDAGITNIKKEAFKLQDKVVDKVSDVVNDGIDSLTKFAAGNSNKKGTTPPPFAIGINVSESTPKTNKGLSSGIVDSGYQQKTIESVDNLVFKHQLNKQVLGPDVVVNTDLKIDNNDIPDYKSMSTDKPLPEPNDTITMSSKISYKIVTNDLNDTRKPISLSLDTKFSEKNDIPNPRNIKYTQIILPKNDVTAYHT